MPPIPVAPGTIQAVLAWSGPDGVQARNVLHTQTPTPNAPTGADMVTLANQVLAACAGSTGKLQGLIGAGWVLENVTCVQLDGALEEGVSTGAALTSSGGGVLSPNVAACVSWHAKSRYRGGHPRTYFPAVQTVSVDNTGGRLFTTAAMANYVSAATSIQAALNTGGIANLGQLQQGFTRYTYVDNPNKPGKKMPTDPVWVPIIGAPTMDNRLDSQRRRLGKP